MGLLAADPICTDIVLGWNVPSPKIESVGPPEPVGWGAIVVPSATTEYVGFAGVAVGEPVLVAVV